MSLEYAVERLYEMGWPGSGGLRLSNGQAYPSVAEIKREFAEAGLKFQVSHVALFNCHRAEWSGAEGSSEGASGYCVGATESEAAVYALAQLCGSRLAAGV